MTAIRRNTASGSPEFAHPATHLRMTAALDGRWSRGGWLGDGAPEPGFPTAQDSRPVQTASRRCESIAEIQSLTALTALVRGHSRPALCAARS